MHEIVKYFILTEIQEQCLNPMPEPLQPLIGPGRPAEGSGRGVFAHAHTAGMHGEWRITPPICHPQCMGRGWVAVVVLCSRGNRALFPIPEAFLRSTQIVQ